MSSTSELNVKKYKLHSPVLQEVAQVLQKGLEHDFAEVSVEVVKCPDLMKEPFSLSDRGLCGRPCVADVGGVPYLVPLIQPDKAYNLEKVADLTEHNNGLVIGAGAGPSQIEGFNSELIANIKAGYVNNTRLCKVQHDQDCTPLRSNPSTGMESKVTSEETLEGKKYMLMNSSTTDFRLLGNFFICNGDPGLVLEVRVAKRIGSENFMSAIQTSLKKHYGDHPGSVGGTFLVEKGKVLAHVMPQEFSSVPLETDAAVDQWLQFFNMDAPLVCVGYLVSHDPGLDLRMEHFHFFSDHGDGGHYHEDITPDDVLYRGYFNVAEYLYRIDQPLTTHNIGRDAYKGEVIVK